MIYFLKSIKTIVFLCAFFILGSVYSQRNYEHYTSLDGLQHDVTYNIIQDSKGYIWVGTDDGLSKFDGKSFRNYSLKEGLTSNYVTDIVELSNDKYAISTWGGGLHFLENDSIFKNQKFNDFNAKSYDLKLLKKKIYTTSGSELLVYDLAKEIFTSKIYLNSKKGFVDKFSPNLSYKKMNPIILSDKLYVHNKSEKGNHYKGINEFKSDFKIIPSFSFLSNFEISSALELYEGNFIFANNNNLLFTNKSKIITEFQIPNISAREQIVKILKVPNTKSEYVLLVRMVTGKKRLLIFNTNSNKITNIDNLLKLDVGVSDILFDFENNLWITTFGNGIYCYYYSNPKIKSILKNEYFLDAIKKENKIFGLTSSHLYEFSNDTIVNKYKIDGSAKNINLVENEIYISALNDYFNLDFKVKRGRFFDETNNFSVRQSDTIFINKKAVLISNELFIKLIKEEDGKLSLFTNKGKWEYDLDEMNLSKNKSFQKNLPSEKINDISFNKNTIYIATDKGLVIKEGNKILNVFNTENGLQNERINCLHIKDNAIFLGTQSGLSLIKNNKVYNFSKPYGIQSLAINKIIELDKNLWLFGNNGVSSLKMDEIKASKSPKLIVNQNSFVFNYEVISYSDQNTINLQYRIDEAKWKTISNLKGQLNFNNFKAKDYKVNFRTRKGNSDWLYSNTFSFTIETPWYKIWWIIVLSFIIFSFFIGLGFSIRLKIAAKRNQQLKDEIGKRVIAENELREVRDNIARDFHDDLGNKLASISLLSEVLSKKVESKESTIIKTIKNDADYLYKGTKDFIFSLQEKSNYLKEVIVYLSDFAEDYLYQFDTDFEVQSNITSNIKLPFYWSKQIIYIFKEAITNSAKHAKAKNAKMIFNFENNQLFIEFKDDGIGFDTEAVRQNGILNMKERASKIKCEILIKSSNIDGTAILFIGKLPQ